MPSERGRRKPLRPAHDRRADGHGARIAVGNTPPRWRPASFDLYLGEVRLTADWDAGVLLDAGGALNYGGFASEQPPA